LLIGFSFINNGRETFLKMKSIRVSYFLLEKVDIFFILVVVNNRAKLLGKYRFMLTISIDSCNKLVNKIILIDNKFFLIKIL